MIGAVRACIIGDCRTKALSLVYSYAIFDGIAKKAVCPESAGTKFSIIMSGKRIRTY
jgi:hypothetical protein